MTDIRTTPEEVAFATVDRLFELIDAAEFDRAIDLFEPDCVYLRPGYPAICGRDDLLDFYRNVRIVVDGLHTRLSSVSNHGSVAYRGSFVGHVKAQPDPVEVDFVDCFDFAASDLIARRQTFFFVESI